MTAPRHARRPQPCSVDRFGPVFTLRVLLGSAMTAYRYDHPEERPMIRRLREQRRIDAAWAEHLRAFEALERRRSPYMTIREARRLDQAQRDLIRDFTSRDLRSAR